MANMNNMSRIPAWNGSAEKWTEYENMDLWFEQSLKPSERLQPVARTLASTGTLQSIQRDRNTRVRCGFMLNYWPKEGFTGKHRETDPCLHMLAEVIRRLQESRTEPTKTVFKEAQNIVKSWTPNFLRHLVWDGEHTRHGETVPGTPKTAIFSTLVRSSSATRKHHGGRDDSWHSVEQM